MEIKRRPTATIPLLLSLFWVNKEGLLSNAQPIESSSSDPSEPISQTSTSTVSQSTESQMSDFKPIDTFTAIALGLAILSLVANGVLLWMLQDFKDKVKKLLESNSNKKAIEAQKQPSISQIQITELQYELKKHTRQIGDVENRLNTLFSKKSGAEFATVRDSFSGQTAPPPTEDYNKYVQSNWKMPSENFLEQSIPQPVSSSPYAVLVNEYHTSPKSLEKRATKVSESEDSIHRRRQDSSIKNVTLQNGDNYSNYWVVSVDNLYWLLPKKDLKLDHYSINTFEALFEFQGNPNAQLHIIKPAQVRQGSMIGEWELLERGEIKFV